MIISIPTDEQGKIDLDTASLPLGSAFDELLGHLCNARVPLATQHKIAYAYRRHPELSWRILQQVEEEVGIGDSTTRLLLLACQLQLGTNSIELVQRIEPLESRVFDILKGFLLLRRRSYDGAMFLFKKARFRLGVQMCNYYLGNFSEALKCEDEVVRAYCVVSRGVSEESLEEAGELLRTRGKRDILFRLGLSEEYDNEGSLDVKVRKMERLVEEGRWSEARETMGSVPRNEETLYLLGKMEHKCGNVCEAKKYYMESLEYDKGYFTSEYNLQRIVQEEMRDVSYESSEFCDFKAYLKMKRKDINVSLVGCSREFKDVVSAIVEGNSRMSAGLGKYLKLVGNELIDEFVVMNNIGYFLCRRMEPFSDEPESDGSEGADRFLVGSIGIKNDGVEERRREGEKYLRRALEGCPDEYKDTIRYNLGYVTEDVEMLMESPLKEAKVVVASRFQGDGGMVDVGELELLGHYHMKRKEFKLAKKIFQRQDTVYSYIGLGNIYLREFVREGNGSSVKRAMETFSKGLRSYYCANGIGICLAVSGRVDDAIGVFRSVAMDWVGGYVNLGNALVLCKRYREAVEAFLKVGGMKYASEMVVQICKMTGDVESCRLCVSNGVYDLKEYLFELLVGKNQLSEASRLEIRNESLVRLYEEKRRMEEKEREEVKRKMEEIKEYRKKRGG